MTLVTTNIMTAAGSSAGAAITAEGLAADVDIMQMQPETTAVKGFKSIMASQQGLVDSAEEMIEVASDEATGSFGWLQLLQEVSGKPLPQNPMLGGKELPQTAQSSVSVAIQLVVGKGNKLPKSDLPQTVAGLPEVDIDSMLQEGMARMQSVGEMLTSTSGGFKLEQLLPPMPVATLPEMPQFASSTNPMSILAPIAGAVNTTASQIAESFTPVLADVDIPVGQKGWDKSVSERVAFMIGQKIQSAEIRLHPSEMGPIEIKISMQNDQATVSFVAQHAGTREALENSMMRLREMFDEQNINLGSVDVSQQNQQSAGGQGMDGEASSRQDGGFSVDGASESEDDSGSNAQVISRRLVGLVDAFA